MKECRKHYPKLMAAPKEIGRKPNGMGECKHGGVRGRKTKVGRKQLRFPPTQLYMYYFHIDFIVRTRPVAGLPLMVMLLYILLGYTSKVCAMDPLPVNNSTDDWSI